MIVLPITSAGGAGEQPSGTTTLMSPRLWTSASSTRLVNKGMDGNCSGVGRYTITSPSISPRIGHSSIGLHRLAMTIILLYRNDTRKILH